LLISLLNIRKNEAIHLKLTVAISGASGANLGINFIKKLPLDIEVFLVVSKSAKKALMLENKISIKKLFEDKNNITILKDSDIGACIASGSFQIDKMIILPCSMNTLAKCAVGISDSLITRAFTVMLKEKREIVIAPREMPLNSIALENMLRLSKLGITIAPPMLGYYSNQQNLKEMENFLIGKWFDLLKIEHNLYERWK
jgi:4-hydroxy-3-polyprenylbenzoate decarboxylase